MSIPAGWYNDGAGQLRWWDGTQWTAHVTPSPLIAAPAQSAPPAPVPEVPAPPAPPAEIPDADDAPPVETVAAVFDPPPAVDAALIPPVPGASAPPQLGAVASSAMPTSVLPPGALAPQNTIPAQAPAQPQLPPVVAAYDKARRNPNFWVVIIAIAVVAVFFAFFWAIGVARSAPTPTANAITAPAITPPSVDPFATPDPFGPDPWSGMDQIGASDDKDAALAMAQEYADWGDMSKQAIYDWLTDDFMGEYFTHDAAQYAIDNVQADWNANALAAAQGYSDFAHSSRAQIEDMLSSEIVGGFTPDEVQYALDNVQADFKQNALDAAREVQTIMPGYTHDDIWQYLTGPSVGFTDEEAQYALDNL